MKIKKTAIDKNAAVRRQKNRVYYNEYISVSFLLFRIVSLSRILISQQPRSLRLPFLIILNPLLNPALETMRRHSPAIARAIGVRLAHPETPRRTIVRHGTSQIGIFLKIFSNTDESVSFWCCLQAHVVSSLSGPRPGLIAP